MKHIKLKVIKQSFLMIEKNAEKHCNMLMNFTKLELTQVNFHGGRSSELTFVSRIFSGTPHLVVS